MISSLWQRTPVEQVSEAIWGDPRLRAAFHIGQVEQTVADIFGIGADDSGVPDEIRRFAMIMLDALWGNRSWEIAAEEMAKIVQAWRAGVN